MDVRISKYGTVTKARPTQPINVLVPLERVALDEAREERLLPKGVHMIMRARIAQRGDQAAMDDYQSNWSLRLSLLDWLLADDGIPWEWFKSFSQ